MMEKYHQKINQKRWYFFHHFLIDFFNVCLIDILLNFHLILIEFSFDLCGLACVFQCCIDVFADRTGRTCMEQK